MLFQVYGENAMYQWLGWIMVFVSLIAANEVARRSKTGGIVCFLGIPAVLTVYFIAIYVCAGMGMEWALDNPTYLHMGIKDILKFATEIGVSCGDCPRLYPLSLNAHLFHVLPNSTLGNSFSCFA